MANTLEQIQRLHGLHRFCLITAIGVAVVSSIGISVTFFNVTDAASTILSMTIVDNPTASDDVSAQSPATSIPGHGAPGSLLGYLSTPPSTVPPAESPPSVIGQPPLEVQITIQTDTNEEFVVSNAAGQPSTLLRLTDSQPNFAGNVGIPNALLFIEIHSDPATVITASLSAESDGSWTWQPPRKITEGPHDFFLTIFDPKGETVLGKLTFGFIIQPAGSGQSVVEYPPSQTEPSEQSLLDQRKVLFDVRVDLVGLETGEVLNPGDELLASVLLFNVGAAGRLVDAEVTYRLMNDRNQTVFQQTETIAVSTQTSVLKRFETKQSFPEGNYRLVVSVVYDGTEAYSYHNFKVAGPAVLLLPGNTKVNVSFIFELLMAVMTIALLITYLEYKQVESLRKQIHQVTEDDLRREGLIS